MRGREHDGAGRPAVRRWLRSDRRSRWSSDAGRDFLGRPHAGRWRLPGPRARRAGRISERGRSGGAAAGARGQSVLARAPVRPGRLALFPRSARPGRPRRCSRRGECRSARPIMPAHDAAHAHPVICAPVDRYVPFDLRKRLLRAWSERGSGSGRLRCAWQHQLHRSKPALRSAHADPIGNASAG